jgi:5-methylcytosine-specific restriction endonuclease McrA
MNSSAWQATRLAAFAVHGRACQNCGAMGPLQVHHRTYERLGHERIEDLRVLCKYCHSKADRERERESARRPATVRSSFSIKEKS